MMNAPDIKKRLAGERGHTSLAWLESYHSFSFGDYYDAHYDRFRDLRVINEDRVAPGGGFGLHPHRNMEILSYVVEGALTHRDSLGNEQTVRAGGFQYMSAGRGIEHSEFNASEISPVHFLQIWIVPDQLNTVPRYGEWRGSEGELGLIPAITPNGADKTLAIRQEVSVFVGRTLKQQEVNYEVASGRGVWVQLIDGELKVCGCQLQAGDGVAMENGSVVEIESIQPSHFLLFDLV